MRNLTRDELRAAQRDYVKGLCLPTTIDGVYFSLTPTRCLSFRYKNASDLIFADNGYNGITEDGRDFYLLWRLSCEYSNVVTYNPRFSPNLYDAAKAVISSWEKFTK